MGDTTPRAWTQDTTPVDADDPETRHPPFFSGMVRANEGFFPSGEKKAEKTVL